MSLERKEYKIKISVGGGFYFEIRSARKWIEEMKKRIIKKWFGLAERSPALYIFFGLRVDGGAFK